MKPLLLAIRLTAVCVLVTLNGNGFPSGDVYHGEFINEDQNGVTIAIDPCGKAHRIRIPYYSLSELGERTCPGPNGRSYRNVQVVEKAEPAPADHEKNKDKEKDKEKDKDTKDPNRDKDQNKDKDRGPSR